MEITVVNLLYARLIFRLSITFFVFMIAKEASNLSEFPVHKTTCTVFVSSIMRLSRKKVRCLNWGKLQGFLCTPFFKYYLADRYFFHRPLIKVTTEWVAQTKTDIVTRKYRNLPTVLQRNNVYLDNRDFQRCLLRQDSTFYQAEDTIKCPSFFVY